MLDYLRSIFRLPRAVLFYLLSEMMFGIGVGMAVILNFHYLALGLDTTVIGFATALYSVIVAVVSYPAGIFTDRFGAKKAMLIGAGILVLGYLSIAFATTALTLYLAQAVLGTGVAFVISCEFPYIMSLCERKEDETTAYNLLVAAFTLTLSLGNILGTKLPQWLPAGNTKYQTTIFLVALALAIMFVLRVFLPANSKRVEAAERTEQQKKASWRVVPSRQVIVYIAYATLSGIIFSMVNPFENVILRDRYSFSDDAVGYLLAVNSFLIFLATLFTPYLMSTRWRRTVLYAAFALQLALIFLMGLPVASFLFGLFLIGKGFIGNLINSFVDSSMMKATPDNERGLHAGLRNLSRSGAGAAVAGLGGALLASGNTHTIYFVAFLIVAVQVLVYTLFVRRHLSSDLGEKF